MTNVYKEFRDFISRGNVIDLAVAVIIGIAFTGIVNAIVAGLITPLIGMIGGSNYEDLVFTINDSQFRYGDVINAVIRFVLIAAAVFFFIVKPINVLNERRRRGEEEAAPEELSDEAALLTEIRDLLSAQAGPGEQVPPRAGF
ncbi:MAG TPA: large conductance mechanosensitive channel protein MscL [Acidimicrobiales bacterium]|nr:large conductance mechanosensitive channel protein MscL [Acidimicrobiales bacterium]